MSFKFNPLSGQFDMVDQGGSLFLSPVATEGDLTLLDPDGAVRVVLDTDRTYVYDATLSKWYDSGISAAAFSAVADAKGLTITAVTTGDIIQHQATLHAATDTTPGAVSVGAQSFGGNKTFVNDIQVDGTVKSNTIDSKASGDTLAIGGTNADTINIGNSSAIVNLIGDVNIQNVTNLDVDAKLITTNVGGAAGSGSDSGTQVEENGVATAYVKTSADRNSYRIKAPNKDGEIYLAPSTGALNLVISAGNLTSNQVLSAPDITGTVVVTEGTQTINGDKTISGTTNFSGLTASTPLKLDGSKNLVSADIVLTTDVTGTLPVANGGTNSATALNNDKVMVSTAGSIVESATTTTQLGYLDATSSIQTQLNSKEPTITILGANRGGTGIDGSSAANGSLLIGNGTGYTAATLTAGTGINVTNGAGTITVANANANIGDIPTTTFSAITSGVAADITGAAFANGVVRSFDLKLQALGGGTYQHFTIKGIQRGANWQMSQSSFGDDAGIVFSITNAGQLQYTSIQDLTLKFNAQVIGI